jgi:hypothetical protein
MYSIILFQRWAGDASGLLTGREVLFEEDLPRDAVFDALLQPNPALDLLTRQALELMFSSFLVVTRRQLKDHLDEGKCASNTWSSERVAETSSVPRTNVGPERIFAQLDNLIRVMPRATTIAQGEYFIYIQFIQLFI